jgi:hypothetical protein
VISLFRRFLVSLTFLEADQEISQPQKRIAPYVQDPDVDDSRKGWKLGTMNQDNAIDRESPDLFNGHPPVEDPVHVTGFFEPSSKEQWLRAIAMTESEPTVEEADGICQRHGPYAAANEQTGSYNFWTDNETIEFELSVGPYALPPLETAERLLSC